jgi:hypothetical protein
MRAFYALIKKQLARGPETEREYFFKKTQIQGNGAAEK